MSSRKPLDELALSPRAQPVTQPPAPADGQPEWVGQRAKLRPVAIPGQPAAPNAAAPEQLPAQRVVDEPAKPPRAKKANKSANKKRVGERSSEALALSPRKSAPQESKVEGPFETEVVAAVSPKARVKGSSQFFFLSFLVFRSSALQRPSRPRRPRTRHRHVRRARPAAVVSSASSRASQVRRPRLLPPTQRRPTQRPTARKTPLRRTCLQRGLRASAEASSPRRSPLPWQPCHPAPL